MVATARKQTHRSLRRQAFRPGRVRTSAAVATAGILSGLSACSAPQPVITIHMSDLESAAPARFRPLGTLILSSDADLGPGATRLDERLVLVSCPVQTAPPVLRGALPADCGPGGTLVGVGLRLGVCLDGLSPIRIDEFRQTQGAGMLKVDLTPATYLPDGTLYLDLAYLDRPSAVLVVDVDEVRYYPDGGDGSTTPAAGVRPVR